jgi:hypothetical protein
VKRRSTTIAAFAVAAMAVVGCSSNPKAKAVAEDIVESLAGLTEAQRTCMLDKLDDYTTDQLQEIGEANEGISSTSEGDAELQAFTADLNTCMADA